MVRGSIAQPGAAGGCLRPSWSEFIAYRTAQASSRLADSTSRNRFTDGCRRRPEAGQEVETAPVSVRRTASALRDPGTMQKIDRAARDGRQGQRQSAGRHVIQHLEATVVHLLAARGRVEVHNPYPARVLEISHRRIVECQMTVLADPHASDVQRGFPQQSLVAGTLGIQVGSHPIQAHGTGRAERD